MVKYFDWKYQQLDQQSYLFQTIFIVLLLCHLLQFVSFKTYSNYGKSLWSYKYYVMLSF